MADAGEAASHLPLRSARSVAHARAPLPVAAGALPVTSRGAANQKRDPDCPGVRHPLLLPRSGRSRWRRQQRALISWAEARRRGRCRSRVSAHWQENSWSQEGAAFRNLLWEQSVKCRANLGPRRRGTEVTWPAEGTVPGGLRWLRKKRTAGVEATTV